ncbi:flagellar basal body L-ring protein FlgH [Zavarzinia compransoris]|uniref:Flagellar L-ring protein n=1 Tax=Zavarzinia compransoris TaxID=1264899 RepID=A0A317E037_9PROT|nr:flagellar basal body L-ring protein FlgH [Zavarzinia compransoris]PWR19794.1 flagellar basal body L-ring protein [Zavarzinia compransoris]TDP45102.1 flagellar L-ring protein precursor FlgH [Zavarzinia compransoris]
MFEKIAPSRFARLLLVIAAAGSLGACSGMAERLDRVGRAPDLTPIANPTAAPGYTPVSLPMPNDPGAGASASSSLWQQGSRAFFKDNRAARVGDILTVAIDITDQADVKNQTGRTRDSTENLGLGGLFGLETSVVGQALPAGYAPAAAVDLSSGTATSGNGTIKRSEAVRMTVAAVVTQVLPNGNLVIQGRQEVRVNYEVRELLIAGIVRPSDITAANTIRHTQIAEARISYGGRGQISDVQQPRYGQQVLDAILPF